MSHEEDLFEKYKGYVTSIAVKMNKGNNLEDLISESYLSLWQLIPILIEKSFPENVERNYIYTTVLRNLCDYISHDQLIKRSWSQYRKIRDGKSTDIKIENEIALEHKCVPSRLPIMEDIIREANLPERELKVLLGLLSGKSNIEIAKELGIDKGNIPYTKTKLKGKLREVLS